MTEYWVSQGKKWCDFCKIFIANNPLSIRNHDLGTRHKESVANRLTSMRKENVAKEKRQKEAIKSLEQIEAKAKRSYQKDIATFQEIRDAKMNALDTEEDDTEAAKSFSVTKDWDYDSASGYYYNRATSYYYDPKSGFYYSDFIGKWVTQEEAFATLQATSDTKPKDSILKRPLSVSDVGQVLEIKSSVSSTLPPGPVHSGSLNPMRSMKGVSSSVTVVKRRRLDEKPKATSKDESAAIKARDAAKKRVEEREKSLLGLYRPL